MSNSGPGSLRHRIRLDERGYRYHMVALGYRGSFDFPAPRAEVSGLVKTPDTGG